MKKLIFGVAMLSMLVTYSQKKKNGTIYIEHPAIDLVESMEQAFVAGDADKVASFLAEDYQFWNGVGTNKDAKPGTIENARNNVKWWKENMSYVSLERAGGTYPDAMEYKDDEQKDVVWVQNWSRLKALNNKTGMKVDVPVHRIYRVNKDNKIDLIVNYTNDLFWNRFRSTFAVRENGTIFINHENINTVRKMVYALEFNDVEGMFSHFSDKAQFRNIHMPIGSWHNMEEERKSVADFLEAFEILGIDEQGYPDYLEYGEGNAKVVQSWWKFRLKRKSDDKKIILPMMLLNDFNDEGKIIRESLYYSLSVLQAKE